MKKRLIGLFVLTVCVALAAGPLPRAVSGEVYVGAGGPREVAHFSHQDIREDLEAAMDELERLDGKEFYRRLLELAWSDCADAVFNSGGAEALLAGGEVKCDRIFLAEVKAAFEKLGRLPSDFPESAAQGIIHTTEDRDWREEELRCFADFLRSWSNEGLADRVEGLVYYFSTFDSPAVLGLIQEVFDKLSEEKRRYIVSELRESGCGEPEALMIVSGFPEPETNAPAELTARDAAAAIEEACATEDYDATLSVISYMRPLLMEPSAGEDGVDSERLRETADVVVGFVESVLRLPESQRTDLVDNYKLYDALGFALWTGNARAIALLERSVREGTLPKWQLGWALSDARSDDPEVMAHLVELSFTLSHAHVIYDTETWEKIGVARLRELALQKAEEHPSYGWDYVLAETRQPMALDLLATLLPYDEDAPRDHWTVAAAYHAALALAEAGDARGTAFFTREFEKGVLTMEYGAPSQYAQAYVTPRGLREFVERSYDVYGQGTFKLCIDLIAASQNALIEMGREDVLWKSD
jgi:hypothetical protein